MSSLLCRRIASSSNLSYRRGSPVEMAYLMQSSSSSSPPWKATMHHTFSTNAKATTDRRSMLAEKMGKFSNSNHSNSSNSSNSSSSSSNVKSSSSKPAAKSNESYLKTWLGNDMAGQSYLQQMVAASKAKLKQQPLSSSSSSSSSPSVQAGSMEGSTENIENPMMEFLRQRKNTSNQSIGDAIAQSSTLSPSASQSAPVPSSTSSHISPQNSSNIDFSSLSRASYDISTILIDMTQDWDTLGGLLNKSLLPCDVDSKDHESSVVVLEVHGDGDCDGGKDVLTKAIALIQVMIHK